MLGVRIAGTGRYLPGPALDSAAVAAFLTRHHDGLSASAHERILGTTGIETRHFALDTEDDTRRETNTSMAVAAARHALESARWQASDVDLLVVTTVVPDQLMPPTTTFVQERLGIPRCTEIEVSGNCSAPYKAILIAANQIQLGQCRRALVCCAQFASFLGWPPWMNPAAMDEHQGHLRWTLSDGAAAIALENGEPDIGLRVWLQSSGCDKLAGMTVALGAARSDLRGAYERGEQHVTQNPRLVLREVMMSVTDELERMLRAFEIPGESIDHFIPAVTSVPLMRRLQDIFRERCGIRPESWRTTLQRAGYLGGVTFPFTVDELARAGTLRPRELVCSVAEESSKWIGAGAVFRWNPA